MKLKSIFGTEQSVKLSWAEQMAVAWMDLVESVEEEVFTGVDPKG